MQWRQQIVVVAVCWGLAQPLMAASRPDDLFFDAAGLALDADLARSQANWPKAHAQYTRALAQLTELRRAHAAWNPEVVEYRMRVYRQQLENLDRLLQPRSAPAPAPTAAPAPPPIPPDLREKILAAEAKLAAAALARQKQQETETERTSARAPGERKWNDPRTTLMELGAGLAR